MTALLDTPWWATWTRDDVARWLDDVRAIRCDVVWCTTLERPRATAEYFMPPWVSSDAFQLRELLTAYRELLEVA